MPLSEFEIRKIEIIVGQYCANKTPSHIKDKLQITFKIINNEVWIYEKRPIWNNPTDWSEMPVAKTKYILKTKQWTLYWADRNSKWHIYEEIKPNKDIKNILQEIDSDPTGIFWG